MHEFLAFFFLQTYGQGLFLCVMCCIQVCNRSETRENEYKMLKMYIVYDVPEPKSAEVKVRASNPEVKLPK